VFERVQKGDAVIEFAVESLETPALTKAQLADLLFDQIGLNAEPCRGQGRQAVGVR
jgi:hypothetical protein